MARSSPRGALIAGAEGVPSAPDGQLASQDMPTADGEMASNGSEAIIPPELIPPELIPPDPDSPAPDQPEPDQPEPDQPEPELPDPPSPVE